MDKIIGIYKITNLINQHLYIGASRNCQKRWWDHRTKAMKPNKEEDRKKVLYKAMRKYGLVNFQFEIIEECKAEELNEREQFWISHYNTYEDRQHYNLTPGGDTVGETQIKRGEDSRMALLTEEQVIFCRNLYKNGENRPIVVWLEYFQEDIGYSGFVKMYTGQTWSHVMPEVFLERLGNRRFSYEDALKFKQEFEESGLSLNQFSKTKKGIVGYGTLWKMVNTPDVYKPKK